MTSLLLLGMGLALHANAQFRGSVPNNDAVFVYNPGATVNSLINHQVYVRNPDMPPMVGGPLIEIYPRVVTYMVPEDFISPYIKSDMSMGVMYKYNFTFRLGARAGRSQAAPPKGWYLVQFAVIRQHRADQYGNSPNGGDPYRRYVTSTSEIVYFEGSDKTVQMKLRFPNVTTTSMEHQLYMEIIPLKEKCAVEESKGTVNCIRENTLGEADASASILHPRAGTKSYLMKMPFIPHMPSNAKESDVQDVRPEDVPYREKTLADYILNAVAAQDSRRATRGSSPQTYAASRKLRLLMTDDPIFRQVQIDLGQRMNLKRELENLLLKRAAVIRAPKNLGELYVALCQILYERGLRHVPKATTLESFAGMMGGAGTIPNPAYTCYQGAREMMRISRVVHIGRVDSAKVQRIEQKGLIYNVMANFMVSTSNSRDQYASVSFKPGVILPDIMPFKFFDFGMGMSVSENHSRAESGIASVMESLDFNYLLMNIPTHHSQPCLEVRAIPNSHIYVSPRVQLPGLYICAPKQQRLEVVETYAHIFGRGKDSTLIRSYDPLSQPVNIAIRGERDLSAFFYSVRSNIAADHDNSLPAMDTVPQAQEYLANTPSSFNMISVSPFEFDGDYVPSFLSRVSSQYKY